MAKRRLDNLMVDLGLVMSRSQAKSYIRLGKVKVNGSLAVKPGLLVDEHGPRIKLNVPDQYVGRAALKLASIVDKFKLDFKDKVILDVGSSTGGFTDFALRHGAKLVYAVDRGTNQLHPKLRDNPQIKLFEKTDIRDFVPEISPDIVLIDVSFISLREILPYLSQISNESTQIIAMVKPQFEAGNDNLKHKGVIKNERIRRQILKSFEDWTAQRFIIVNKADSHVAGSKGNLERFYALKKL